MREPAPPPDLPNAPTASNASLSLAAARELLTSAPVGLFLLFGLLTAIASITEGLGLLALVPVLQLLQDADAGANAGGITAWLAPLLEAVGVPLRIESLLLLFLLLIAIRAGVQYSQSLLSARLQHRVVDGLRERVLRVLLGAEWRWIARRRRADILSTLLNDVGRIGVGLHFGFQLAVGLVTMLVYLAAAFALDASLTLIAVIGGGVLLLAVIGHQRAAVRLGWQLSDAHRDMTGVLEGSLTNLKLAKILGTERRQLEFFLDVLLHLRTQEFRFTANTSRTRALLQVIGAALLTAYLYVGLTIVGTPVAELMVLVLIAARLIPMLSGSLQQAAQVLHALPAATETAQLIAAAEQHVEPAPRASAPAPTPQREICLEGVSVRYEGRDTTALDAVSVCFPVRTTTAIIGASGAGKSTLADVLMGLLKPDAGALRIDDTVLTEPQRRHWRSAVAYVPQETFLFNDSIRNNLLWGEPAADDEALTEALRRAAADFVLDLPQGLDTLVGDGGLRLSGGERQRIALARALLRRPALILLDEATSALDLTTEQQVRDALRQLHGSTSVVMIAHRLATLAHADQVVVLDAGRVVRVGTWDEVRTAAVGIDHAMA
jgi:ATP-binding cassette subfamily C protein